MADRQKRTDRAVTYQERIPVFHLRTRSIRFLQRPLMISFLPLQQRFAISYNNPGFIEFDRRARRNCIQEEKRNGQKTREIQQRDLLTWPYGGTGKQAERKASIVVAEVNGSPSNTTVSIGNDNSNLKKCRFGQILPV